MIFRSPNSTSPDVDIQIDGVAINYNSIQQAVLELEVNQHDLVRLVFAGLPPQSLMDLINAPIKLSWYQGKSGHEFRGYIAYVEPTYKSSYGQINGSPLQLSTVVCLGASFDMKAKKNRVWDVTNLPAVTTILAHEYHYTCEVPASSFTPPRLLQSNESDWAFLVRVATMSGFVVNCDNTHIRVWDPMNSLGRETSFHALVVAGSPDNPKVTNSPGIILSMQGPFGQVTPRGSNNDKTLDVLDSDGNLFAPIYPTESSGLGRGLSKRFTDTLNVMAPDLASAQAIVRSHKNNSFSLHATLECTGTAGIVPGGVVNIDKFDAKFDGLWFVRSVKQTVTFDKFFTEVEVVKDSTNEDPYAINALPRPLVIPNSELVNKVWKASQQQDDIYA